jgi:hypothetical protein
VYFKISFLATSGFKRKIVFVKKNLKIFPKNSRWNFVSYIILQTNTFQMVLATDEVYTYAMYNYAQLQWTTHTEAGGDTTGGEGGTPAYVS